MYLIDENIANKVLGYAPLVVDEGGSNSPLSNFKGLADDPAEFSKWTFLKGLASRRSFDQAVQTVFNRVNWNEGWVCVTTGDTIISSASVLASKCTTISDVWYTLNTYKNLVETGQLPEYDTIAAPQVVPLIEQKVSTISGVPRNRVAKILWETYWATFSDVKEISDYSIIHPISFKVNKPNLIPASGTDTSHNPTDQNKPQNIIEEVINMLKLGIYVSVGTAVIGGVVYLNNTFGITSKVKKLYTGKANASKA